MRCFSSSGMWPPARSASSSFGISTSSTKRRARSRSSSCSGVKSAAVWAAGAAGRDGHRRELQVVVVVDDVLDERAGLGHGRVVRARRPARAPRPGSGARRAGSRGVTSRSARAPLALHQRRRRGAAGAQRRDRRGQLALGFGRDREPCVAGAKRTHARHGIMRLITKSGCLTRDGLDREPLRATAPRTAPLEPRYYRDPEIAELEQRRIFARTWQLVGARVAAAEPRQLPHRARPARSPCSCCATRTASCAPSATSAATAARAC